MDSNVIVFLFIAFVISSLVRKFQGRQRENQRELESRGTSRRTIPRAEPDLSEVDPSEWDIFAEPEPEARPLPRNEFREVRGARSVSEQDTGREFQEVRGARTISEADSGPEFRDPLADDDEEIPETYRRVEVPDIVAKAVRAVTPPAKSRRKKLRFDRNALVNGILFQEILGPPRSEKMPW